MKVAKQHTEYGEIVYDESAWTGKKTLFIDGKQLEKVSKNEFVTENGDSVFVKGSLLTGTKVTIGNETIELTPSIKWYEAVLALLPLIFNLVWGNVVALCAIIPMVGGAIGGLINGGIAMLSLMLMKRTQSVGLKIIIGLGMFCVGFLLCFLIGLGILGAMGAI